MKQHRKLDYYAPQLLIRLHRHAWEFQTLTLWLDHWLNVFRKWLRLKRVPQTLLNLLLLKVLQSQHVHQRKTNWSLKKRINLGEWECRSSQPLHRLLHLAIRSQPPPRQWRSLVPPSMKKFSSRKVFPLSVHYHNSPAFNHSPTPTRTLRKENLQKESTKPICINDKRKTVKVKNTVV